MSELVKHDGGSVVAAQAQDDAVAILGLIAQAAKDPAVDVSKMERLIALQERIMDKRAEAAYIQALARAQARMPRVARTGQITMKGQVINRYSRFEDIDEVVRPILSEEGITVEFLPAQAKSGVALCMRVCHVGGHKETGEPLEAPRDDSGAKNSTQGVGSTISYLKRYLLMAKFNIITVGEDDDGQGTKQISQDQMNQVMDLIASTNADQVGFLRFMGVEKFDQITMRDFPKAINALREKARKQGVVR